MLDRGETFPNGRITRVECCSLLKKDALQAIIEEKDYQAVIVGIRRDEEGTRAKERYFSPRDKNFEWNFKDQPPELWDQFKTDFDPGTHIRIHPLLNWTEVNVWEYIHRESIPVVGPLFFERRDAISELGLCAVHETDPVERSERFRDHRRTQYTRVSERSTRAQDQETEDAFERLRSSGYM